MTGTVRVVAWRSEWPELFVRERMRLATVFDGPGEHIEHVGSTSVVGLAAKPIIDIMVGVKALDDVEARIGALEALGYQYVPEYESEIPERRYFRRPHRRPRTHHVHCVVLGGRLWTRHLAFRDHLRTHPDDAEAYGRLKRRLARRSTRDRRAYLEGKDPFIRRILEEVVS